MLTNQYHNVEYVMLDFLSCNSLRFENLDLYRNIGNLNDWMSPYLFRILVVAIIFSSMSNCLIRVVENEYLILYKVK